MVKRIFRGVKRIWQRYNGCDGAMRAASLTYFTLLGLVPILCVLLCTAKWCGLDRYARDRMNAYADRIIASVESGQDDLPGLALVDRYIDVEESRQVKRELAHDFGVKAREAVNGIFDRVDGFSVGTLGWIGFLGLLWTVVSTISVVETSFNRILGDEKPRPLWRRAILYLLLATVVPALTAAALSLPALNAVKQVIVATLGANWLTRWAGDGLLWLLDSTLLRQTFAFLGGTLALGFLFWLIPARRMRWRPVLAGGAVTTLVFAAWVKACAIAQIGIAKSSALYGSFALLPIVLAWVYVSWQIVLLGFTVTCAFGDRLALAEDRP